MLPRGSRNGCTREGTPRVCNAPLSLLSHLLNPQGLHSFLIGTEITQHEIAKTQLEANVVSVQTWVVVDHR